MSLLINHFYRFAEFTLDADQGVLLREGKPLPLTPKVFDTLLILVENNGRLVTKDELMDRLWPDTFVEEANLAFNIQQLRKALGDNARHPIYIETVARRGYRFIANVEEVLSTNGGAQITERFEGSDARSRDADHEFKSEIKAREPEPAIKEGKQKHLAITAKNLNAPPGVDAVSTSVIKKPVALASALLILVAGVGFVLWKMSNGSNKNPAENKTSVSRSPERLPLKVEKLTGTGRSHFVAISPDGKYVAYTSGFERNQGIWLRQLATNTNIEIVRANGIVSGLAFANSGEYLYFVRGNPSALYRVSLLGGVPTKTIDDLEGKFSISSDDSQIAFIRQVTNRDGLKQYSLIISRLDGSNERTLLAGTQPDRPDAPVWSPDRQLIICAYGNSEGGGQDVSIVEVRVSDGTKRELSSNRFFHITRIAWLPNKNALIISAARSVADDAVQLWRISYPTLQPSQITEGLTSYEDLSVTADAERAVASEATRISDIWVGSGREPRSLRKITQANDAFCWTPDGQLLYSSMASGIGDLWIMRRDGTEQRQLTVNAAANGTPAATSDNRYIVFMSNRTGAFQVWRMNIDGTDQIQLTYGVAKNFPAISPDGRWVIYNSTDNWHLWKVSIDGGEPSQLTDYIASHAAVSPDGSMIACVGRNEAKRELLILSFEGGQPLRRFDFAAWSSRIQWTPDGKALIYAAEQDGVTAIVRQSLNGGPAEKITGLDEDELFDFGYSFDGRFLAVTRGGWQHDVVLISDLNRH